MTETELTDRLRETIVLDGPDAWQRTSYLQDAQAMGISLETALKRAAEINQEVTNNSLLYQNIRARIARMAQPSRSHLVSQDLNQIINAASSLNLSPDFVRNRWVPTVLQQQVITTAPAPPVIEAKPVPVEPIRPEPEPVVSVSEPTPVPETVRQPEPPAPTPKPEPVITVTQPAPVYEPDPVRPPESPPVVRSFTASPARVYKGQTVTLSWDVANLLAVTIDDLGQGLSPQNRGWVKPAKTTDYSLFDANNNPLSTVRVEVIKRDRSGIYGVLFAVALLVLIYWFIRNNNSPQKAEPARKSRTERLNTSETESRWTEPASSPPPAEDVASDTEGTINTAMDLKPDPGNEVVSEASSAPESDLPSAKASKPETTAADARQGKYEESFGNKPYDKVELGTDDQGWRRARSNGHWGYVDANDEWVIEPEYDAVTPFRGNTARVFRDGQLITINRSGEQVRNP